MAVNSYAENLQISIEDSAAVVKLACGITNPIGTELIHELSIFLDYVRQEPRIHSLLLTSANNKFFSIGFDIPRLYDLDVEEFRAFYRQFNKLCLDLYGLAKPTIASIPGHAVAGGCILALCCDQRFIKEGRALMGLNEVRLGVTVPHIAECIVIQLCSGRAAREILEFGKYYQPPESLELGLVDAVIADDQLFSCSLERAALLGSLPAEAYAAIKQGRVERVMNKVIDNGEQRDMEFVNLWYSSEARELLSKAKEQY